MRENAIIIVDYINNADNVGFTKFYRSKRSFRAARARMNGVVVKNVIDRAKSIYLNDHASINQYLAEV